MAFIQLNKAQETAVQTTEGRLLVLAGAGSGKTRVIVQRIASLILEKNVSPEVIVGLTFTNKAAHEMRERVEALIGPFQTKKVILSTFHSFCMRVLREDIASLGFTRHFSLYDEGDMERLIGHIVRDMLGHRGPLPSLAKTRSTLTEAFHHSKPGDAHPWHDQFSQDLFLRLQSTLRAHNAVSFDHLIHLTIRLFEEHPNVLERYQEKCRYLMIDEYQDTNPSQFRLAELLVGKYNNLCVVGDDDQSIYGWRGAEVSHILHFKADQIIKLEQNYRSTPSILDAANGLIAHNKTRHNKKLWTQTAAGAPIEVFHAPTEIEEARSVIKKLCRQREEHHLSWKQIAILYRSNALSRALEMALMEAPWQKEGVWVKGIPYEVFGGLEFAERSEIKDIFAYLRAIANPSDEEAWLRILNVPRRGISDDFLDALTQTGRTTQTPLWKVLEEIASGKKSWSSHPRGVAGVRSFLDTLASARARFAQKPLDAALLWLLEAIQYKRAILEDVKSDTMRAFKWDNVQECVNALAQYEADNPEGLLQDFIADTALGKQTFSHKTKKAHEDRVQLMTLHSAKGLEFPAVFIVGLEDHILPHEKSLAGTGIEEERRLFYVGLTRARQFLTLSMAQSRMRMGKTQPSAPSRFLFEIPPHLLHPTDGT